MIDTMNRIITWPVVITFCVTAVAITRVWRKITREVGQRAYNAGYMRGYSEGTELVLHGVQNVNNMRLLSEQMGETMGPREYVSLLQEAMVTVVRRGREEKGLPNE